MLAHQLAMPAEEHHGADGRERLVGAGAIRMGVVLAANTWSRCASLPRNVSAIMRSVGAKPKSSVIATRRRDRSTGGGAANAPRSRTAPPITVLSGSRGSVADHRGEQQAQVRHGARHRTERRELDPGRIAPLARNQPERRTQADDAAERGRVAAGAAGIRAGRDRHHAAGERRARSAGRAGRRACRIERIAGRAIDGVARVGARAPFGRVGLAEHDRARGAQRRHHALVALGDVILEDRTARGGRQALGVDQVLHAERQAVQAPKRVAAHHLLLGGAGRRERALEVARHHRVDGGIDLLDAADAALRQLERRQPLGADQRAGLGGGEITRRSVSRKLLIPGAGRRSPARCPAQRARQLAQHDRHRHREPDQRRGAARRDHQHRGERRARAAPSSAARARP